MTSERSINVRVRYADKQEAVLSFPSSLPSHCLEATSATLAGLLRHRYPELPPYQVVAVTLNANESLSLELYDLLCQTSLTIERTLEQITDHTTRQQLTRIKQDADAIIESSE